MIEVFGRTSSRQTKGLTLFSSILILNAEKLLPRKVYKSKLKDTASEATYIDPENQYAFSSFLEETIKIYKISR